MQRGKKEMSSFNRFVEGIAIGGVLGFVCGLLSAPKSGAELRKQLADESEDLYKQATESIQDMKSKTNETISTLQAKGEDLLKMASDKIPSKKEPV
jgi:gas vesicle protein